MDWHSLIGNLACFLAGMPAGAWVFRRWLNRHDREVLGEHDD